jgi:hypothetical protein
MAPDRPPRHKQAPALGVRLLIEAAIVALVLLALYPGVL